MKAKVKKIKKSKTKKSKVPAFEFLVVGPDQNYRFTFAVSATDALNYVVQGGSNKEGTYYVVPTSKMEIFQVLIEPADPLVTINKL